jgi:predicted DNA-binding transcriptional regulator YafY
MNKQNSEQKVQINRILMIDEAIRSGRYPNATKLAKIAEVSVRTIWRDIEYLRLMYNAPLKYSKEKRGYYYTEGNFFIKSLILTEGELFSIALFDRLLVQYRNTPIEENLRTIFKKIIDAMPAKITVDTDFLSPRVSLIPAHAPDIQPDVFKTVFSALQGNETIKFDYRAVSKTTFIQFAVDPYHAVYHSGAWYIIGYCHYNKTPLIFSFSRMRNVKPVHEKFEIPSDFNSDDYFDKEIGIWISDRTPFTVELLFDGSVVTLALEQYWNRTQEIIQKPDGSIYVRFTTTQIHEVLQRVLCYGSMITVINPPELIEMIKNEVIKMQKKYK